MPSSLRKQGPTITTALDVSSRFRGNDESLKRSPMSANLNQPAASVIDAMPQVMGDDGQFHAQDEAVDLSGTAPEAWVALGFFWILGSVVFYQFFTRYVLNDSAAWTEEIARYLLIAVVFTGATIGVAKNSHIQVDFFYRFMPKPLARGMAAAVDVIRIGFFAAAAVLTVMMMLKLGSNSRMTMID